MVKGGVKIMLRVVSPFEGDKEEPYRGGDAIKAFFFFNKHASKFRKFRWHENFSKMAKLPGLTQE